MDEEIEQMMDDAMNSGSEEELGGGFEEPGEEEPGDFFLSGLGQRKSHSGLRRDDILDRHLEALDGLLRRASVDECHAIIDLTTVNDPDFLDVRSAPCFWPLNVHLNLFDVPCGVLDGYHKYCKSTPAGARHAELLDRLDAGDVDEAEMSASTSKGQRMLSDAIRNHRCDLVELLLPYVPLSEHFVMMLTAWYGPNLEPVAHKILNTHPIGSYAVSELLRERDLATIALPALLSRGPKLLKSVKKLRDLLWLEENGLCLDDPKALEYFLSSDLCDMAKASEVANYLVSRCPPSVRAVRIAKSSNYYYALLAPLKEVEELYRACGQQYRTAIPEAEYIDSRIDNYPWPSSRPLDRDALRVVYQGLKEHAPGVFGICARGCPNVELLVQVAGDWLPGSWFGFTPYNDRILAQYKRASTEQCSAYLASRGKHKNLERIASKRLAQLAEESML